MKTIQNFDVGEVLTSGELKCSPGESLSDYLKAPAKFAVRRVKTHCAYFYNSAVNYQQADIYARQTFIFSTISVSIY